MYRNKEWHYCDVASNRMHVVTCPCCTVMSTHGVIISESDTLYTYMTTLGGMIITEQSKGDYKMAG